VSSSQGCEPRLIGPAGMLGRNCTGPPAPRTGGCLREEDEGGPARRRFDIPKGASLMEIKLVDPRSLVENPDRARRSKSSPQSDALLPATIKAVGIVQPPVVAPQVDGGNGFVIQSGHRRVKQAIAAGLEEIAVLVGDPAEDGGAMRSMVENTARENLNPVDQ